MATPERSIENGYIPGDQVGEIKYSKEGVPYVERMLFTSERIQSQLDEDATWIENEFAGRNVLFVPVLLGGLSVGHELLKRVNLDDDIELECIRIGSYGNSTVSNEVPVVIWDIQVDVEGRDVLAIEDVVHTGYTIAFLRNYFERKGARSVAIYSLVDKPEQRKIDVHPDRVGLTAPSEWLERFGMDTDGLNRNRRYITYRDFEV